MRARQPHEGEAPPENWWFGVLTGLAFATVACGGILGQRLSRGDVKSALVAHVLLTLAALAMMRTVTRGTLAAPKLAGQLLGGGLGIVLAHGWLHSSHFEGLPWLSEHPAQLVNDVVAVFAPLMVVWAVSRRPPSTVVLVATLALVTVYRMTGVMWHLDAAQFSYSVQDFVTTEFAGSALGIATFTLFVPA